MREFLSFNVKESTLLCSDIAVNEIKSKILDGFDKNNFNLVQDIFQGFITVIQWFICENNFYLMALMLFSDDSFIF